MELSQNVRASTLCLLELSDVQSPSQNPSRSQWGWRTRYQNHIYPNRYKIDEDYVLSNGLTSKANASTAVPNQTLKRCPSEDLDLPPSKRVAIDVRLASHTSAHSASPTLIAPPPQFSTVNAAPNSRKSLASKFTREDLVAAISWVTMRTRPKSMFQNLASWEQFAEQVCTICSMLLRPVLMVIICRSIHRTILKSGCSTTITSESFSNSSSNTLSLRLRDILFLAASTLQLFASDASFTADIPTPPH